VPHVLIEGCWFDTGDDRIALASAQQRRTPPQRARRERRHPGSVMADGHGGRHRQRSRGARTLSERCRLDSPQLARALRIKTNAVRGGVVEDVYMRDVTVGQVAEAVVTVNYFYEEGDKGTFLPVVRNVEVRRVTSRKSKYALLLRGFAQDPIQDIRLTDCTFDGVASPDVIENVTGLTLTNVRINGQLRNETITK
jgi:polygalacturonase